MIRLLIDVKQLDKTKFKRHGERLIAELIMFPTPGNKFAQFMIKQDRTKEEREAGKSMPILGDGINITSEKDVF